MSRIGKKPVTIDKDVTIAKTGKTIEVSGPKGKLSMDIEDYVDLNVEDGQVVFTRKNELKKTKALHGLYRALLQNMVTGCKEGYSKKLELVGIGYKAELKNEKMLLLQLGYSHPIVFIPPAEVKIEVPAPTQIVISGIDKQLVGATAAKIRSFRKPEPYKGKGIKYETEFIRRKAGKTAAK